MGKISLSKIKSEIQKSGNSKGKFLFFKDGTKYRVRFLSDMEEGLEVKMHDSFALGVNVPCQEQYGRECEYCEDDNLRTRNMYAWSVYDYESKEVKLLFFAVNQCSPIPSMASLYESYGTLCDRDYEIKQTGSQQNKTFSVIPLEKMKFRNTKVKALSDSAILKYIDKAYPADNSEDLEEEEDEPKKKPSKTKIKAKSEPKNDEWEEDETNETDYESMKPQELFKLCKERDIDCKPRKSKEYYIDLLEEADEEEGTDDWDEEETNDDEWED